MNDTTIIRISNYVQGIDSIEKSCVDSLCLLHGDLIVHRRIKMILGITFNAFWVNGNGYEDYYSDDSCKNSLFTNTSYGTYNYFWNHTKRWDKKIYYINQKIVSYSEIKFEDNDSWFNWKADSTKIKYKITLYFSDKMIIYSKIEGRLRKKEKYLNSILNCYKENL